MPVLYSIFYLVNNTMSIIEQEEVPVVFLNALVKETVDIVVTRYRFTKSGLKEETSFTK